MILTKGSITGDYLGYKLPCSLSKYHIQVKFDFLTISGEHCAQATKKAQLGDNESTLHGFETCGPTKWTSVQQKFDYKCRWVKVKNSTRTT